MLRMIKNCYRVASRSRRGPLGKYLTFLAAMATYSSRVRRPGLEGNLELVLEKTSPFAHFYYCISYNASMGWFSLAYIAPGDKWLGIPIGSAHTTEAEVSGAITRLVMRPATAATVHTRIVSTVIPYV
jgi:hypothetical protein